MIPVTLDRVWQRARRKIGRTDLHYHDLRHTGLTWAAASGASVAELMVRGGHASPTAALRYQHATEGPRSSNRRCARRTSDGKSRTIQRESQQDQKESVSARSSLPRESPKRQRSEAVAATADCLAVMSRSR